MRRWGHSTTSISGLCGAAALATLLCLPCAAQEFTETRRFENAEQVREVTGLKWWQSSAVGIAVGFTQVARRRIGLEREHGVEPETPQPTVGVRYRFSEQASLALAAVFDSSRRSQTDAPSDRDVLARGFAGRSPSFAANLRSGLKFKMDDGYQMHVKVRRSGVNLMVKKEFY